MAYNLKKLGDYIEQIDLRNTDLLVDILLGVSIDKKFIPSIANTIGTDFSKYKIVEKGQFAYGPVTSRNGDKISIALLETIDKCLVSSSYITFKITKKEELNEEYLMMIFSSPEFDRYARYNSWGSARETFSWTDFCDTKIKIPNKEEQLKIIEKHKNIQNRIRILKELKDKLIDYSLLQYKRLIETSETKKGTLKDIYEFQYGKGNNNPDNGGEYPVYGSNGIIGGYTEYNNEDIPVIGHIGSCGALNFAFGRVYVTYNGVMCNIKNLDYKYFGYLTLMNSHLEELNIGTTQPFLSYDMLYDVEIDIPNKNSIIEFDKNISNIFCLIEKYNNEIVELEKLKKVFLSSI